MHVNQIPAMKGCFYRATPAPAKPLPLTAEQQAAHDAAQSLHESLTWEHRWNQQRAARNAQSVVRYAS